MEKAKRDIWGVMQKYKKSLPLLLSKIKKNIEYECPAGKLLDHFWIRIVSRNRLKYCLEFHHGETIFLI